MKDMILSFGLSGSMEEAMSKVEAKLEHDAFFAKTWAGGAFYPVAVHAAMPRKGWANQ